MKKIKLLIIVFICLSIANVKADMGAPTVVEHDAVVTNKSGAQCYSGEKKTGEVIPYGTTVRVFDDINGSFIYVSNDKYNCDVKYSDISAKNQSFSLKNESISKLNSATKAIVLAKGGLNMRKGPAVTYGRITTVPQYSVVTLTYSAGTYWYYTTYNGKSGWITGMDGYLGFDGKEVLISHKAVKIYSANGKSVLGTIPANTEIEEYIELSGTPYSNFYYYVIYNGNKGYIQEIMGHKTDGKGKIKLTKDYVLYDDNGKATKKITAGQEFEYSIKYGYSEFYIPEKNEILYLTNDQFEYVKETKELTKTKGYIGEGLFGEPKTAKTEVTEPEKEEPKEQEKEPIIPKEEKKDYKDIIIIGLLAGIFAALTALVIIKLVNSKKKPVITQKIEEEPVKKDESITVPDKDIVKAREEIIREMQKEQEQVDNNKEV